jgi:plastocyanin
VSTYPKLEQQLPERAIGRRSWLWVIAPIAASAAISGALAISARNEASGPATHARLGHIDGVPVPPAEKVPSQTIDVYEYGFNPERMLIKTGQVVAWKDVGKQIHRIVPGNRAALPIWKTAQRGGSARYVFDKPGFYRYYCAIHPRMKGEIVVRNRV